jgi:hypothetical protein
VLIAFYLDIGVEIPLFNQLHLFDKLIYRNDHIPEKEDRKYQK